MAGEADRMAICIMSLTLAVRTEERKKKKKRNEKKRNEKNTDGKSVGGVCVCYGAAGR